MFNIADVKTVFSGKIVASWEEKSRYIEKIKGDDNKIIFFIKKYIKPNMNILEIGCGTGKLLQEIDKLYNNINLTGIELSSDMIDNANKKIFNNNIDLINVAVEDFSTTKKYDMIIMKQVLHHLKSKESVLKKLSMYLNSNGVIIIMTPNEEYQENVIKFKANNDVLGRISDAMIYNYISKLPLNIEHIEHVNSIAEFYSLYEYFMFLYSIGSLQKIFNYTDKYVYGLNFIYIFRKIFKKRNPVFVSFNYSYIVMKRIEKM